MLILSPQDVALSEMPHPNTQKMLPVLTYQSRHFTLVRKFGPGDRQMALDFCKDLVDNRRKFCILLEEAHRYSVWGRLKPLAIAPNQTPTAKLSSTDGTVSPLFSAQDQQSLLSLSEDEFSQVVLKKLNQQRKILGRIALNTVHRHPSAQYRRTSNVFVAYRDGGGLTYGFIIHWFRELALGVGKNLTTKIAWEVVEKQHFRAEVVEDESIFSPSHGEDLDRLFANLLP